MESLLELIAWDASYNQILAFNLALLIVLFTSLRLFSGIISHINAAEEFFKKDNPAFGISVAGVAFAVTIILSGTVYGDPVQDIHDSMIAIGLYGLFGIALMALTRIIVDKISLRELSIRDEIVSGNIAAAIVDASHVIATGIIIRGVMVWIAANTIEGLQALIIGYVVSQVILMVTSWLRIHLFSMQRDGASLQQQVKQGNVAVALYFAGRKIGTAFAITAASQLMLYTLLDIQKLLVAWTFVSVIMIALLAVISWIADRLIFFRVNVQDEVIEQRNIAVGALQAVTYISLGLFLSQLVV